MLSRLEYELKWKNDFDKESEEYNFLNSLNYNTNKEEVAKYTSFTDADKKILDDNRNELKELNLSLIKRKLTDEKRKNCEIESVINDIKLAQELISESNIKEFIKSEKDLLKDIEEKNSGLEQTASEYGVELFNTKEYKQFIIAAEEYIRNLSSEYPEENSKCIFCQQELSEESINLISSYRKVLCKGNESKKLEIKGKIDTFKEKVNNLNGKIMFRNNVFGKLSDMEVIQPEFITDYNFKIMDFKSLIEADNIEINFEYDFENALEELGNKQAEINDVKSEYENTIQGLEDQETKIIQRIRTLEYREKLSSLKEEIEKYIKDRKLYKKLSSYKRLLNTNSLSRKTSEARSDLIQKNFKELFERELEQLGKSKLNISLEFGTVRGKSKLIQDMNKYSVSEVLSEGEQKAIALSEFLAELKLEKSVAPVVFDDPVNSLDHLLIEKFAKRMLKLSKERQVIVFTHSILLFNSLVYQIMNTYKYLDSQKYNVSRQYGVPGYLSSFEEPINSPKKYIKEINVMLNNPDKSRPEDSVAAEGYGLLRSAIEVFVEYEMLQSVVKRYQKNVALSLLTKIDGASIDSNKQELNDVFTRCCGFISGHSNPEIVVQSATLDELKTDFDKFKDIRGKFV